jgi:hypothetical protein
MAITLPSCPVPVINNNGITVPLFADYYNYLNNLFLAVYGNDTYLAADAQDAQLIGAQAQAMADSAMAAAQAYNAMSPLTAVGVGLSSVIKINGIRRGSPVAGQAPITLTGTPGTVITNGVVGDGFGNQWTLPSPQTIVGGSITVTANAVASPGPVVAPGTIIYIVSGGVSGWTGLSNPGASTQGTVAELDGALRQRQTYSTALPSQTLLIGLQGQLASLPGVTRSQVYNNGTNATDTNGVPAHSIWCVVEGGSVSAIGTAIAVGKTLGCGMKGSINFSYTSPNSTTTETINYDIPTQTRIVATITVKALSNYVSTTNPLIQAAVVAYGNTLPIGGVFAWDETVETCKLDGTPVAGSYRVQSVLLSVFGGSLAAADIQIAAGATANVNPSDITIVVTS